MSVQPRYDQETEGHVYDVTPSYQTESVSEIVTETDSTMSGMTIESDEVDGEYFFVTHHGRQQPASANVPRWMPTDNTRRDILRHVVERYIFNGNYMGPVWDILSKVGEGEDFQVLEFGTRSGTWVQEVANEFPNVQFRSLDIAPTVAHTPRSNIVFEVYDVTEEGIMLEDNSQAMVFINGGVELVKDYPELLREAHRVLRFGGLIHIREFGLGLWKSDNIDVPATQTNPAGCQVFDLMRTALTQYGADPEACAKVDKWLSPDSGLWADCKDPKGFERIFSRIRTIYLNPHPGYPCAANLPPQIIPWICYFHAVCARDAVGMMCDAGMDEEVAGELAEEMIRESKDPRNCPVLKWYGLYATKPHPTP